MSSTNSPAPANAGRYPEMPSEAHQAILTAQYGCVPTSGNTGISMNAPAIVDKHHDIEAPGAPFPEISPANHAILNAMYGYPGSFLSTKKTCTPAEMCIQVKKN